MQPQILLSMSIHIPSSKSFLKLTWINTEILGSQGTSSSSSKAFPLLLLHNKSCEALAWEVQSSILISPLQQEKGQIHHFLPVWHFCLIVAVHWVLNLPYNWKKTFQQSSGFHCVCFTVLSITNCWKIWNSKWSRVTKPASAWIQTELFWGMLWHVLLVLGVVIPSLLLELW